MKSLNIIILFSLTAFLISCEQAQNQLDNNDQVNESKTEAIDNSKENVAPEERVENNSIQVRGYIEVPPENKAIISAYYGGYVRSLSLLNGQSVKKGDYLFSLTNPDYLNMQQEYLMAKENIEFMQSDYNRQKELVNENIASGKSFSKVEADYRTAKSKYQALKEQMKLLNININKLEQGVFSPTVNIYAPIGGMISMINISTGQYLDEKTPAVEIVNTDHLHLELEVYERDIAKIKKGQPITFMAPEYSSVQLNASVHLINSIIHAEKRTAGIHAHIESSIDSLQLMPGMFVEAEIFTK
ncbi:efflux RND transporter periplasmic adaptor subunit [Fulvivirga lutimaris]|uniref:efflux RND transporter periplasmic adaptor subunit n=1 Tax=Fulvivirga lutimaris TaxID=1819566 RepID=UPI0012BC5E17|nr:efflux RND transporter periplasmic adaptor subunit [Fulvivirga lutimaris]MTI40709.1 efflux RND transporter periplasmic adaptor subunit [Fulvivirga lutimaris]